MMNENNENKETIENKENKSSKPKKNSIGRELFEWFYTIVIAVAIAFLIKGFLFDIVKVDGSSMFPTLVHEDRLIVTKLGYEPEQGDIIILDSTYNKRNDYFEQLEQSTGKKINAASRFIKSYTTVPKELKRRYYVKRVIAMPGQTVDLKGGKVYVDGVMLEEDYGYTQSIDMNVEYPVTVEEGHVFVMGDNREHSKDSRHSDLGQVPFEAVLGKSQIRIWPLNQIGITR